jgi:acyl-CoA dehydrogenase
MDFAPSPTLQPILDKVSRFIRDEAIPLERQFHGSFKKLLPELGKLRQRVKELGLWGPQLPRELGGMGLSLLEHGQISEVLGRTPLGHYLFNCQAPDSGNMEILITHGTDEQKKRWLEPMLAQEMFSAYSMTEPAGGSDPNLFVTAAVRDGEEWVINGEKWFTSAGRYADLLFVMCTNGIFVVPREAPGVEFLDTGPRAHSHIRYTDVRVPLDHLLGPENGAKVLAQRRLGGGRIHHCMRGIAQTKLAFDMMCERALSRQSHGKVIAEHQMVQEAVADSYAEINMLRLLVLWTAWSIDNSSTQATRTQISACKFTCAKVLKDVTYRALHVFGSLGMTDLTPLLSQWENAPAMAVMDGVDEVHKVVVARNVLAQYRPHEGLWPTEFLPHKREAARKKLEPLLAANPDLKRYADGMAAYMSNRHG